MNGKQLITLLVLGAILGGAGLLLYRHRNASWEQRQTAMGGVLLRDFPVNDIDRVAIRQGTNTVNLVKQGEEWRVRERHDYPADFSRLSRFLLKMRDLKFVRSEKVGPSQLPKLQLAPPGNGTNAALEVAFLGREDKPIRTLLLGKSHRKEPTGQAQFDAPDGWPDGRYVRVGEADTVALVADPLEDIEPKPDNWLDKDFIRVDKVRAVEVAFPNATNSWKLTRDTQWGPWKLANPRPGETLDASKTASLSNPLSSPSFLDVLPGGALNGAGTNKPTVVRIDTFDDFDYTITVGGETNMDYPVTVAVTAQLPKLRVAGAQEKPEDKARLDKEFHEQRRKLEDKLKREQGYEKWTYLVASWVMDPLLKERSQLLAERKETAKENSKTPAAAENGAEPSKEPASTEPVSANGS